MSHNVLARTKQQGDETVVEAITKVQSIDLVADPATTSGLYEHADGAVAAAGSAAGAAAGEPPVATLESVTLDELRRHRPELICEIEQACESQLAQMRRRLDETLAKQEADRRREQVLRLLQENDLPLPTKNGDVDSYLVSPQFIETLMQAADEENVRLLIEERAALVRTACRWANSQSASDRRPKSKDQLAIAFGASIAPVRTAADFAAGLRG